MKALVVIVHYFSAEPDPQHASVDASRRAERTQAVEQVVRAYRGSFGAPSTLRFRSMDYRLQLPLGPEVDLRVLTVPGCSLLSDDFRQAWGVEQTLVEPENPRMLGFEAYRIFAEFAQDYDWFVFTEDDLLVRDPMLFTKLAWFNKIFGDRRVLQPNRFEWNDRAHTQKTYIDGDITEETRERLFAPVEDGEFMSATAMASQFVFRRARNPHSGFFAVTAAQLAHWMAQPHWMDRDTSFYTPLESAATLGLTKSFSVYKPFGHSAGFLEIEHRDNRFSSQKGWPLTRPAPPPT